MWKIFPRRLFIIKYNSVLKWFSTDVRSCLMARLINSDRFFISKMTQTHKNIIGTRRNNFVLKFDLYNVHSFVRCIQRFCDMKILLVLFLQNCSDLAHW